MDGWWSPGVREVVAPYESKCAGIEYTSKPQPEVPVSVLYKGDTVTLSSRAKEMANQPTWASSLIVNTRNLDEITDINNAFYDAVNLNETRLLNETDYRLGQPIRRYMVEDDDQLKAQFYELLSKTKTGKNILAKNNIEWNGIE